MKLRLCHVYPDVLNLYGDRGNVLCLENRMRRRGIEVKTEKLCLGDKMRLNDCDMAFIGGGQDFEQRLLLEDLRHGAAGEIKSAVEDGLTVLAVCGGYQMLGNYYETQNGERCDFIGALDLCTIGEKKRMIGNVSFLVPETGCEAVGFENHSGRTYLGAGLRPLGLVIEGCGNNGRDGTEGARYKNVFGTYSHGPLLPKNPLLADLIIKTALLRRYGKCELTELDDRLERLAHDERIKP